MKNMFKYACKPLTDHTSAQCRVWIEDNRKIEFWSYHTMVCKIDKDGYLLCTGTYSATTRKQISWFLREYAPALNYYDVKAIAGKAEKIHIATKEVKRTRRAA